MELRCSGDEISGEAEGREGETLTQEGEPGVREDEGDKERERGKEKRKREVYQGRSISVDVNQGQRHRCLLRAQELC